MDDLIANKVDILTIGQYLRPTRNHHPMSHTWDGLTQHSLVKIVETTTLILSEPEVLGFLKYQVQAEQDGNVAGTGHS